MKLFSPVLALAWAGLTVATFAQPAAPGASDAGGGAARSEAGLERRLGQIDAMVQERLGTQNIPSYCLAIVKAGKVVFQKSYGWANLETRQRATNDTVYGLASLTKTFTALTLLSLVDRGLVGLDDPLSKYVGGLTAPYQSLTIRQLASMTAGVPARLSEEVLWKDQLPILVRTPLASKPGDAFLYSNYSYRLLGAVIAQVTGRPFLEVVNETIVNPLHLTSTATTVLLKSGGREAQGYEPTGNDRVRPVPYKNPAVSFSAGMLASTSNDLIKYVLALLSGKIVSKQGYNTMWYERPPLRSGQPSPWAFGWSAGRNKNFGGQFAVAMNGGTPGVASTLILLPEANSAVIALCNLRQPAVYDIARTAARMAFGDGQAAEVEDGHPEGAGD